MILQKQKHPFSFTGNFYIDTYYSLAGIFTVLTLTAAGLPLFLSYVF